MTDHSRHGVQSRFAPPPSTALAALAALFLLTWVAAFWSLHDNWRGRETAALQLVDNEASEAETRVARLIRDADKTLLALRAARPDGDMAADLARLDPNQRSGGVALLAPDGRVLAESAHANTVGWPKLMARLAIPDDTLVVGEPVPGRNGQPSLVPVARRMVGRDGSFAGILMLSLDGDSLSRVPEALAALDGCMTLIGDDGVVLARTPNPRGIVGMRVAAPPPNTEARFGLHSGTGRHVSEIDGVDRIFAWRHLEGVPVRIVAGIGYDAILAGWESFGALVLCAGILASALLGLIGGLWHSQRRRAALSAEALAQVVAHVENGVRVERDGGGIVVANPAGLALPAGNPAIRIERHDLTAGGAVVIGTDRTEREAAQARIEFLSSHDVLTGLPNRWQSAARIQAAIEGRSAFAGIAALILLDLDGFQTINETLGQDAGDEVLREMASRLRELAPGDDLVACLGGDEFLLFLPSPDDETTVMSLSNRIPRLLARPITVRGEPVHLGVSMGIAFHPRDGDNAATLFRHARVALSRAKLAGRGTAHRFDPVMMASFEEHRLIESDLRHALEGNELELRLQPQFSCETLDVTGFEALARWRHPTRGELAPAIFIPIAERSGLIQPLGLWAIEEACKAAASWRVRHRIAVNVSPLQLRCDSIQNDIRAILRRTQFPAHLLELEVTESVLLDEDQRTLETLHKLRAMDIRVALDDFGTGYSSLSYLRRFPFDKIKIDKSFIQSQGADRGTRVILEAMVRMCSDLGFDLVAEGVETEQQLAELRRLGCVEVQGFLLGKPMRPELVDDFLLTHGRRGAGVSQSQTITFSAS